ncbi:hypothetical protein [Pengzhenrongella sp.]|uniref:hypothetical protein n=1 Tax=Pengzhenrongella sp. TaxID=2888820 RepID=UPI002F9390A3
MILPPEVLIVGVYALVLLGVSGALDLAAQHAQKRAETFRTAGFQYHPQHDAWSCSQDEMLWPMEYDEDLRLVRYRAKASVCNGCPVKQNCTDSETGREVTRPIAPWPHSEAGRFHRGLSLSLVVIAGVMILLTVARNLEPWSAVLAVPLALVVLLGLRFSAHFRATPSNFPAPTPSTGLRVTQTSRTRWGSDARRTD